MIHFDLPKQKSSIIKVLGVGGGGSNAVNFMYADNIEGVDFIICNTDAKALEQSKVMNKIQLGPNLTQGLGAGANPEVGKNATQESLDEIKSILEVNTKMAFICAGMGGGTGTGGAPIIAEICRELGILTVGIVTTPFGFEGPRRQLQAEKGIKELEPLVDTLLVISNDKLREQYGNLKMKEAFGKADNVLATAAKCITDIINSRGHIIVDFADVCTVMKNGGVAILGSASVEGEDRAQRAIEEALNSPLLNDNDIRGAKWILININSAEGDHECTMDELEIINNHLRLQAGENTDVIVGMGYDNSLNKKIGITLVATGFEHKDPFPKGVVIQKKPEPKEDKVVMTLSFDLDSQKIEPKEEKKIYNQSPLLFEDKDPYMQKLSEELAQPVSGIKIVEEKISEAPGITMVELDESPSSTPFTFELKMELIEPAVIVLKEEILENKLVEKESGDIQLAPTGLLNKPSNIYAENFSKTETIVPAIINIKNDNVDKTEKGKIPAVIIEDTEMQLVMKEETSVIAQPEVNMENCPDDEEMQRKRASERIQKLRNLSYNMNGTDGGGEFDAVPAYVRRNMELFGNTLTSVENFYSKYTVKKDENEETNISTINTFLDGKKPD